MPQQILLENFKPYFFVSSFLKHVEYIIVICYPWKYLLSQTFNLFWKIF